MKQLLYLIVALCVVASCASSPYHSKSTYRKQTKTYAKQLRSIEPINDSIEVIETVNFSIRKPQFIILHHTDQESCEQTYKTFTTERTQVSAHYVICEDGTITQMLNDYLRAWHAGRGKWFTITDMNSISLGIEIDNDGKEEFSEDQIQALIWLLGKLTKQYGIPKQNIIGHLDWAVGRKVDPSVAFPWKLLAEHGFGIWYDEQALENLELPSDFDATNALKHIGYDVSTPEDALRSFRIHFMQTQREGDLTEQEKKIIYSLSQ